MRSLVLCDLLSFTIHCPVRFGVLAVLCPVRSVILCRPFSCAGLCSMRPLVQWELSAQSAQRVLFLLEQFVSILMDCFHYRGFPRKANSFHLTDIERDAGCLINCITSTSSLTATPRDMVTSSYCYSRLVGKYFISEKGK